MTLINIPTKNGTYIQDSHIFLVRAKGLKKHHDYAFGVKQSVTEFEQVAICTYNPVSQGIERIEIWTKNHGLAFYDYVHTIDKGNGDEPKPLADQETVKKKILMYLETKEAETK